MKKMRLASISGVMACLLSGIAMAQTCAAPLPIASDPMDNIPPIAGDTCGATNSLPTYGGTGSPQNEIVYSFVAQGANATISVVDVGGYGATVFLMPTPCSAATDPIALGQAGTPMAVTGLTDGQAYFVIATADPGGPNNACGAYTVDVHGPLPVKLQDFSIQ